MPTSKRTGPGKARTIVILWPLTFEFDTQAEAEADAAEWRKPRGKGVKPLHTSIETVNGKYIVTVTLPPEG